MRKKKMRMMKRVKMMRKKKMKMRMMKRVMRTKRNNYSN